MSDDTPYVLSPAGDILASGPTPATGPGWGRRLAVGGAGLVVLALAGGGYAAYGALSGGGTQPDTFVPANAVAYVELDLNPPASQKINTVRLLHKLPKGTLKSTSDNYRDLLLSSVFSDDKDINYKTDVEPWLGDRVALAVLPPVAGGQPVAEGVLQVKDEAAFKAAVPKLFKHGDGGYVLRGGFAIVADDSDIAKRVADSAAKADLAGDPDYNIDTKSLGDRIVTGWYDASRAGSLIPQASLTPSLAENFKGRGTFAVHVESNAVELVANQTGGQSTGAGKIALLPKLPSNTVAAVEVTGVGQRVMSQWGQLMKSLKATGVDPTPIIAQYEKQYDIKLPNDLATLLGSDSLGAVTVTNGQPGFGYVALTDKVKASDLIKRVTPALRQFHVPAPAVTDDGLVWGMSPTWVKDAQSGDLGSSAKVKGALPDLASAQFALYIDLDALLNLDEAKALGGSATASARDAGLEALGFTASADGATSHVRIRLTIK